MKHRLNCVRTEMNAARRMWGHMEKERMRELRTLVETHRLSIAQGDVILLDKRWYVTHAGLLRCAHRHHCSGIKTTLDRRLSDPAANRWVFKAVVYGPSKLKAFSGYGDADPFTVSPAVRGAELRVAETRAVNRAPRKAYGISICSLEELGAVSRTTGSNTASSSSYGSKSGEAGKTQPRLRDQLCLLIRQFNLDARLVKAYATDFCGTQELGEATRESVESFIAHISAEAKENRDGLICKLNSFSQPVEVKL